MPEKFHVRNAARGYQLTSARSGKFGHGIKKHLARRAKGTSRCARVFEAGMRPRHTWSQRFACPSRFSETRSSASRSRRNERARTCEKSACTRPCDTYALPCTLRGLYANRNDREAAPKVTERRVYFRTWIILSVPLLSSWGIQPRQKWQAKIALLQPPRNLRWYRCVRNTSGSVVVRLWRFTLW